MEWIKVSDRLPPKKKAVIVYGKQMSAHWPDITYAIWDDKTRTWHNCFAYGGDTMIREEEVDYWTETALPPGLHA